MVSKLQKVGLALGAGTYGDAAASFTRGLLVSKFDVKPSSKIEGVKEVRGDLSTRRVTVPPIDYEATLGFPLDVGDNASANIGHLLQALFGTDTITGSSPYTHTFSRQDSSTPTWFNMFCDAASVDKQYTGFRGTSLKFSIKSDSGMIDVEAQGIVKDEADLVAAQTLAFSGSPLLLPSQATTFTLGGSPVTNFDQLDITIKSEVDRFRPIGTSRAISQAYRKDFSIELALQGLAFSDETERAKFKAVTSSSFNLILTDSNLNYLRFNFPEIYFTGWEGPSINDTDLLRISAAALVTGNSYSVILQNLRSTTYSAT
jgi:hypothetical protein